MHPLRVASTFRGGGVGSAQGPGEEGAGEGRPKRKALALGPGSPFGRLGSSLGRAGGVGPVGSPGAGAASPEKLPGGPPQECKGMLWPRPQIDRAILATPGRPPQEPFTPIGFSLFLCHYWAGPRDQGGTLTFESSGQPLLHSLSARVSATGRRGAGEKRPLQRLHVALPSWHPCPGSYGIVCSLAVFFATAKPIFL